MVTEEIKKLKEKITEIENRNVKLMWKYAPGVFKFIIIVGFLTLMFLSYKFSQYLFS